MSAILALNFLGFFSHDFSFDVLFVDWEHSRGRDIAVETGCEEVMFTLH